MYVELLKDGSDGTKLCLAPSPPPGTPRINRKSVYYSIPKHGSLRNNDGSSSVTLASLLDMHESSGIEL